MRELIRHVEFDGYQIKLYATGETNDRGFAGMRYHLYGYDFITPEGKVLFTGDKFSPPPSFDPLSDETIRELIAFLTLSLGDTDDEYFSDYTPEQMEFANGAAEELSIWSMDVEDEETALHFRDLGVTV